VWEEELAPVVAVSEEESVQVEELAQAKGLVLGLEKELVMVLALALEVLGCHNRRCSGRR